MILKNFFFIQFNFFLLYLNHFFNYQIVNFIIFIFLLNLQIIFNINLDSIFHIFLVISEYI